MPPNDKPTPPSQFDAEGIARHFDEYGMREWDRLVETPVDEVSLYVHTHYLKEYVQDGWRVLEIGAGAGRFTQALAELGTKVLVGDISQVQLDLNKRHAEQHGFAQAVEDWQQVDICDMGRFEAEAFECVVAYGGPLSYVLDQRDQALQECIRVLKRDGLLLLSVMSLWGSVHRHLKGVLPLPVKTNRKIIKTGDLSPETYPERGGNHMHMFRAEELREWLTQANLTILAMSASNCVSIGWEEMLGEIKSDGERWDELLRMELEACGEAGCLNMGTHMIAVVRKD